MAMLTMIVTFTLILSTTNQSINVFVHAAPSSSLHRGVLDANLLYDRSHRDQGNRIHSNLHRHKSHNNRHGEIVRDDFSNVHQEYVSTRGGDSSSSSSSPSPKVVDLTKRTIAAITMITLLTTIVKFFGDNGVKCLVILLQTGMYHEITDVINNNNNDTVVGPIAKWWWFLTIMSCTTFQHLLAGTTMTVNDHTLNLLKFGMVALGLIGSVVRMACISTLSVEDATIFFKNYIGKIAGYNFAMIFLIGQSSFWILTLQSYGLLWIIYPAILVIINDTMAYFFGKAIGRTKLLPRLSPNKTVEGFMGALVSTFAFSVPLLGWMSGSGGDKNDILRHALAMAAYTSLVSPFGGFLASATKRAFGVKDFGKLIPGHGGVLDRFDCHIVTAPFVFLYLAYSGGGGNGIGNQ